MSIKRVVCYGSDVYHKPGCKYVRRMKTMNTLHVTKDDAIRHHCRICRYCNSMNYHLNVEKETISSFESEKNMQFKVIDGILYVKTDIGCWKLIYVRREEKITLYHRNKSFEPINWEHPEKENYHHQNDIPYSETIGNYLSYIYDHDKYKRAVMNGEKITEFSNARSRNLAARCDKKRERRQARNRIDYLFRCIERENAGSKQISYC